MEAKNQDLVRVRLESIAKKHGGLLTPEAVVEDARDPASPLHKHFEWNVETAAFSHWLDTARTLIRSVRVVVSTESRILSTVAYVRDPSLPPDRQGYRSLTSLRSSRQKSRDAVVSEFERAAATLRRAKEIAEVLGMADEVEEIIEMVDAASQKAATV